MTPGRQERLPMAAARCQSRPGPGSSRRRSRKCRQRSPPRRPGGPATGAGISRGGRSGSSSGAGLVRASHIPSGSRTAATTRSKTRGPGSSSTRMTDPAMTPGRVPAMSTRARRPPTCPCRQYRYSAPGVATTLYSRLVGVTAGLGVPSTLTWNGSSKTAPEIPAGVASTAMPYAATSATTSVQPLPSTQSPYKTAPCAGLPPGDKAKTQATLAGGNKVRQRVHITGYESNNANGKVAGRS